MIAIAFAAALLAPTEAPAGTAAEQTSAGSRLEKLKALPATDQDIKRALFEMLERDPQRVVCSIRVATGTRQPRKSCATLKAWFENRRPGEIASEEAPWQLVEEIKDQRKKALLRGGRAGG